MNPLFKNDKEWYESMCEYLEEKYVLDKLDKPFTKRFAMNDPSKPIKKPRAAFGSGKPAKSKKTGLQKLIEERKK